MNAAVNAFFQPSFAIALSYFQHALFIVALCAWLLPQTVVPAGSSRLRSWGQIAASLVVALACAWFTRGWLGELSVLNTLFAASLLAKRGHAQAAMPRAVAVSLAVLGGVLYPSALHLLAFDVYALGYFWPLSLGFLLFAGALCWAGLRSWAWGVVVAVLLWSLNAFYSPNLWDAVLDAPLWFVALAVLIRGLVKKK